MNFSKQTITVDSLILEITRRCNMKCQHCLRGEAENLDMSFEMVDKILSQIDCIGSVCFSGGEPTLNMKVIDYFMEQSQKRGNMPASFYIVTNGKTGQFELATTLLKWYPQMDDQEMCGVCISVDEFHESHKRSDDVLRGLAFYQTDKEMQGSNWVLDRGRANLYCPAANYRPYYQNIEIIDADEQEFRAELIYVCANGNAVGDCDLPFEDADELAVCNISKLRKYAAKATKEWLTNTKQAVLA